MDKNKVLVLGKGFLGKKFEQRGFKVWGKERFTLFPGADVNLRARDFYDVDVIINCMGKSNTRWCEQRENFRATMFSNATIPGMLSDFCKKTGRRFVQISTGCVYDNNKEPQTEAEYLAAHCNYVVTKWAGEQNCSPDDLILRPRLYFSDTEDRNNLLCKLPRFKSFLTEANSFTSLDTIVDSTQALLDAGATGTFNVACDGYATVQELASWIGLSGPGITEAQLHQSQGLYLVNNIMSLDKLKQYYQPPQLRAEVERCQRTLKGS